MSTLQALHTSTSAAHQLVDHVEGLVAPAQDERVAALQHLAAPLLQLLYFVPDRVCAHMHAHMNRLL